jgi:membrane protein DedA with SNARE-associated domain
MARLSRRQRRIALAVAGGLVLVVLVVVVLQAIDHADGLGLLDAATSPTGAYLATALLIIGDAICPIFPGETTLNAAATLAAQGRLDIGLVIVAGAIGAIVGDSLLFWIARRGARHVEPQLAKARADERVAAALEMLDRSAPLLIVAGRYVPGLRFVVNVTMGLSDMPYRRFLPWSALSGALWAAYTSLLAYWIGTALQDYPLGSFVVSSLVTTVVVAAVFIVVRRRGGFRRPAAPGRADPKPPAAT